MNKIYSLIVIDDNKRQHIINLKYYNPKLKVDEITKKVPLIAIVNFTTRLNSKEELICFLKQRNCIPQDISSSCDVVISYEHRKQKRLAVPYNDVTLLQNVPLESDKAIIAKESVINNLFNEIRKLSRNRQYFKDDLVDSIRCQQLKEAFEKYFYGEGTDGPIKNKLSDYRNYYDLTMFCMNFRKKYHIGLETKEELAYQDHQNVQQYYIENLDNILPFNPEPDRSIPIELDDQIDFPDRLFDDDGEAFDTFERKEKLKEIRASLQSKLQIEYEKELFDYYGCKDHGEESPKLLRKS